jgi:hypothetical protein
MEEVRYIGLRKRQYSIKEVSAAYVGMISI